MKLLWILLLCSFHAQAQEFVQEVEKDYPLRSIGKLHVINPKGEVSVQGWALDKIRFKVRKRVTAPSLAQAQALFNGVDYRYHISDGNIEISTQYGKELSIGERLKDEARNQIHVDMQILAPASLKLRVWAVDGKVVLKSWNSQAEIRTNSGAIRADGVKGDQLSVLCASCPIQLKNIRAILRCMGGSGPVDLSYIRGKTVYVETDEGPVKLFRVEGEQLYSSKTGRIEGQSLTGKIEFHTKQASVDLREISGFLSGGVEKGNITAQIQDWEFLDKAFIETTRGNIQLTLPRRFSGNIDIWSMQGTAFLEFPFDKAHDLATFGPEPANHLIGRVSDGGELLKVFTESGDIHVFKGKL